MAIDALLQMEEKDHFWMIGKQSLVRSFLKNMNADDVLDLGCGSGLMLSALSKGDVNLTGIDVSVEAIEYCRKRMPSGVFYKIDAHTLPLGDRSQDLVLALDVFEHAKEDGKLVREVYRVLKPGGKLIVTVPSYQSLFGKHDEDAGHERRYGKRQILELLKSEGFSISYFNYYNFILFPLFYISRKLGLKDKSPGFLTNRILTSVISFENRLSKHIKFPCGSSMIMVGVR